MNDEQRMVTEFHRAFDIVVGTSPAIPDEATCALRVSLIQEECDEVRQAFAQRDVEAVAKELADLLYVVYGTAVSCGIEMRAVFQEVHRSNMSKVGGHKRADGKWIKPPGYSPARLRPILAAQGLRQPQADGPQDQPAVTPLASGNSVGRVERLASMSMSEDDHRIRSLPGDEPIMSESLALPCPRCGKNFIRRSHRQGVRERLLSLFYVYPFRCQVCAHRFKLFQFGVRYSKHLIDRRQYERLPTHVPATFVEAVTAGEGRIGHGVVTDIALGGCYMQTVVELPEGTLLSLELQTVEHAPSIAIEAAIVRSVRPTSVGLQFLRIRESEHERLSQFIHQLFTRPHAAEHGPEGL